MSETKPIILVPIGFSEQSILALDQAVIFAKAMNAWPTNVVPKSDATVLTLGKPANREGPQ